MSDLEKHRQALAVNAQRKSVKGRMAVTKIIALAATFVIVVWLLLVASVVIRKIAPTEMWEATIEAPVRAMGL